MLTRDDVTDSSKTTTASQRREISRAGSTLWAIARAMRPAQWLKNGVVFAGVVFGGRLFEPASLASAILAALLFCLLSGGFYLLNDVRDLEGDRIHPVKRRRPVASGDLAPRTASRAGLFLVVLALVCSWLMGSNFFLAMAAYAILMAGYNLVLKQIIIVDVFVIAAGFVIRAAAGAIAVEVTISPWLLMCTMLLALLIGFGKRRAELVTLTDPARHRRNLEGYSRRMLDQAVAVAAAGTLIAYAVYTFEADSAPPDHRMMLTVPIVAYGIFRYLYLLYGRDEGGTPEALVLTDPGLLASISLWGIVSAALFYFV